MPQITFKRRIICYPPRIELGSIQTMEYPLARGNDILHFCSTVKGERVLLPTYGLPQIVFNSSLSTGEIEAIILSNLSLNFPQTEFKVSCTDDRNEIGERTVEIFYSDKLGTGNVTINI